MPPIEVYAGMDAVRSSAEVLTGLPSRAELEQWLQEHDRIEKETELFDSGELKKLKKLTKGASAAALSLRRTLTRIPWPPCSRNAAHTLACGYGSHRTDPDDHF